METEERARIAELVVEISEMLQTTFEPREGVREEEVLVATALIVSQWARHIGAPPELLTLVREAFDGNS